jgi:hypothetical protein
VGTLRPQSFSTGSAGFGLYGKSSFGTVRYQVTCNVVLIGSNPASPKYVKGRKVTVSLADMAGLLMLALPASLSPATFASGADGFRINGRVHVSDSEAYVLTGQAVRVHSAAK